jgi:hypothetical protein
MAEDRAQSVPDSTAGATWRKSTFSAYNGSCVEVAGLAPGQIGVRDSKDSHSPVLVFNHADWTSFLRTLKR